MYVSHFTFYLFKMYRTIALRMILLQLIIPHPSEKKGDGMGGRGNGRGKIFVIAGKIVGRLRIYEIGPM